MGTLGSKARRIAKRQLYEATHATMTTSISSQTDRPAVRAQEVTGGKILKANPPA